MIRKIPITLLTGFLGSGKTTQLRRMLAQDEWQDTLVLVNEVGQAGLDHHLMASAAETVVVMENGCLCCSVRTDLGAVLEDLFWQRLQRKIPRFARVVIETTGLAEPGPVAAALQGNPLIAQRYVLDQIVCTADALHGERTLERHRESVAQAASADVILVTKTDLAVSQQVAQLEALLQALNPLAPIRHAAAGDLTPGPVRVHSRASGNTSAVAPPAGAGPGYRHSVATLTLEFARLWEPAAFEAALRALLARYGERILRVKGMVALAGTAGPTVVQAVQGTLFPFDPLAAWPDGAGPGFLVLITMGVDAAALAAPFDSHLDRATQQEDRT